MDSFHPVPRENLALSLHCCSLYLTNIQLIQQQKYLQGLLFPENEFLSKNRRMKQRHKWGGFQYTLLSLGSYCFHEIHGRLISLEEVCDFINKYMFLWQSQPLQARFADCRVLDTKRDRFVVCVKVLQRGGNPLSLGVVILSVKQDTTVNPHMTAED